MNKKNKTKKKTNTCDKYSNTANKELVNVKEEAQDDKKTEGDVTVAESDIGATPEITRRYHQLTPIPTLQKKKRSDKKYAVLPVVPIPTENFGDDVYIRLCRLICHCIQNGVASGVPKMFHEFGLTQVFVDSIIKKGVPNRPQMFTVAVEAIRTVCLHQPAQQLVYESGVVGCLICCFSNPNYAKTLLGETSVEFAKKIDELLRHYPRFLSSITKAIIFMLKHLRNKETDEIFLLKDSNESTGSIGSTESNRPTKPTNELTTVT
ncbi:hypothetical protein RFI_10805, partial [Reticulomyxa filosa]